MSEEINPATLKATRDALGKYIKKPPLTDKLLGKPPFKFLHDIFSAVIKGHGLMEGLFTSTEMRSDSFKDKDSKVAYIQKECFRDVVVAGTDVEEMRQILPTNTSSGLLAEFVNGEKLSIRPGKIVAGMEVGKTNLLLQNLATALTTQANSSAAVKKVLAGEKLSGGSKKDKVKKSKRDVSPKKAKDGVSLADSTNKSPDKKSKKDKDDKKRSRKEGVEDKEKKAKKEEKDKSKHKRSKKDSKGEEEKKEKKIKSEIAADAGDQEPEVVRKPRPGSVRPGSVRPGSARPVSVRPTPSPSQSQIPSQPEQERSVTNDDETVGRDPEPEPMLMPMSMSEPEPEPELEPMQMAPAETGGFITDTAGPLNDGGAGFSAPRPRTSRTPRPSSARPAAPRPKARTTAEQQLDDTAAPSPQAAPLVMFDEDDDDDDNFVVEEKKAEPDPGLAAVMQEANTLTQQAEEGQHGLLVSQILETKKSMEEELKEKARTDRNMVSDKRTFLDKDTVRREVVRLRESIQKVTKSANPLGKMMDFLQEDVDSMQRELDRWRSQNKEMTRQIRLEIDMTNNSMEPLRAGLGEFEHSIRDQLDKISAVRASVLQNEDKVGKLMAGVMSVAASPGSPWHETSDPAEPAPDSMLFSRSP